MEEGRARGIMSIENIPPQMLLEIFSRLPVRSLCRMKCVCKQWYHLTRDPFLHRMHLARVSTIEDEPLILTSGFYRHEQGLRTYIGLMTKHCTPSVALCHFPGEFRVNHSFDGLLCSVHVPRHYRLDIKPTVLVSNPLTREHLTLPPFTAVSCNPLGSIFGLGFDSSIKKYKIVCGYFRDIDAQNLRCSLGAQVYTMGISNSSLWRDIMSQPTVPMNNSKNSVYVGSARHWLVYHGYNPNDLGTLVISFDFDKEEFKTLPNPGHFLATSSNDLDLVDLRGYLGIVDVSSREYIQIWMLKEYERNQWVREHRIPTCGLLVIELQVLGLSGADEIVLLKTFLKDDKLEDYNEENEYAKLLAYNLKTTAWRKLNEFQDTSHIFFFKGIGLFSHRGSLVSLLV